MEWTSRQIIAEIDKFLSLFVISVHMFIFLFSNSIALKLNHTKMDINKTIPQTTIILVNCNQALSSVLFRYLR